MTKRVALLVWPGIDLLDFAGAGEVFSIAGGGDAFEVVTVGRAYLDIEPQYTLDGCPPLDVLVVPRGAEDPALAEFVRVRSADTPVVLEVSGGVSGGIDGALRVVGRLLGQAVARDAARYIERSGGHDERHV